MTIDERLEFLARNAESLHASIERLYETVAAQSGQIHDHTAQLRIDAENIRSLARIAEAHEQGE